MEYLLQGGLVIDPASGLEKELDIHIENGRIKAVGSGFSGKGLKVYDLKGKIVAPGFIDMHVHLREPGGEAHETILTGCRAAAAGGFTAVAAMPNTRPCADSEGVVELVRARARQAGLCEVFPIGTVSKGQRGEEISEIGSLYRAGAVAVSDDGKPVTSSEVMRRALEYTKIFGIPVISHSEDCSLSAGGAMHEGYWSTFLGLKGIPAQAEEIMVARDILLASLTAGKLHLAHISTKGSVELLKFALAQGIKVTAEATPHHLLLTDEAVKGYDTNTKVNPPLRGPEHVKAVREAVAAGIIGVIASDHAPWSREEKEQEYDAAPCGISGLETAVPVCWDTLVVSGMMSPVELIARFTTGPAAVLNLRRGMLEAGAPANLTVIDPGLKKQVDVSSFYSKGKNSPLNGRTFQGWPVMTIVEGKVVMEDGRVKED
ncbi:MAG: dihydroorotase [Peptococcaceae bacterium]|jgi:dihydroorotase|nr:dihydroorotase [Peptococcaceae bacterium]MDH7526314.1 dihydroorotase [Peptococcaceae bacterium]